MNQTEKQNLTTKFLDCSIKLKSLIDQIEDIENNINISLIDKKLQMKIIREELNKVGTEIDNIKKRIKLITNHSIN